MELSYKTRGILTIFGSLLVQLVSGTLYLYANISTYIYSFYTYHYQNDLQAVTINAVFPFISFSLAIFINFGLPLGKRFGERKLVIVCGILQGGAVFISSYMENFWFFAFFYGAVFGACGGITYITTLSASFRWFPKYKGTIAGIISAGFGLGAFVMSWIVYAMINPGNDKTQENKGTPDKVFPLEIANNLPPTLRVLGIIYTCLIIIGGILQFPMKPEDQQYAQKYSTYSDNQIQSIQLVCPDVKSAIKSPQLYALLATMFSMSCVGMVVSQNLKTYGIQQQFDDGFLTLVGSIASVLNAFSRIVWGWLVDRYSFKWLFVINLICQAIIIGTLEFVSSSQAGYMIYICLAYLMFGGIFSLFPAVMAITFGKAIGPRVYGIVFLGPSLASFFTFFLVLGVKSDIGFEGIFRIYAGICVSGMILSAFFRFLRDWEPMDILEKSSQTTDGSGIHKLLKGNTSQSSD